MSLLTTGIRPVSLSEIIGLERYEALREELRREVIEHKRSRRIEVGPEIDLVFEDHATVFFQIHEMLRAERITDLDAMREEVEVYNALLPVPGELSATLLIGITEKQSIEERLNRLIGIDEHVCLEVGNEPRIRASFEAGRGREDRLSAVQYIRFALPPAARAAFLDPAVPARIRIEHPNYTAATELTGAVRASLSEDLRTAVQ
jgi:hypothetical protein